MREDSWEQETRRSYPLAERLGGAGLAKPRRLVERPSIGFVLQFDPQIQLSVVFLRGATLGEIRRRRGGLIAEEV